MQDAAIEKMPPQRLVQASADKLREIVLAGEPGVQIGSLREVAGLLGVGIVTVQQAARILEHEGLLLVKRGPGGGYYGARPDDAALERSIAAWLRVHGSGRHEALEMITLLEVELSTAAAACDDENLRGQLRDIAGRVEGCATTEERVAFEEDLQALMFRMVERPLIELLSRVTLRHYKAQPLPAIFPGEDGIATWKAGRRRIIAAILARDVALTRFESDRHRNETLARLRAL
jgi:GntR family transcriptional repressor for pyruvate dehydrogenase complex